MSMGHGEYGEVGVGRQEADADEEGQSKYRYQAPAHLRKKAPLTSPHVPKPVWVQWSNAFWMQSKKDVVDEFTRAWAACPLSDRNELVNHAIDMAVREACSMCVHARTVTIAMVTEHESSPQSL